MHWVGALLHIVDKSRWGMAYLALRLSGYNSSPTTVCYKILYQGMCYLFHHPLVSIMYPKTAPSDIQYLHSYFGKGYEEIRKEVDLYMQDMTAWADGDLARGITVRRSTASTIHTWVAFASQCIKQADIVASANDSDIRSIATKRKL